MVVSVALQWLCLLRYSGCGCCVTVVVFVVLQCLCLLCYSGCVCCVTVVVFGDNVRLTAVDESSLDAATKDKVADPRDTGNCLPLVTQTQMCLLSVLSAGHSDIHMCSKTDHTTVFTNTLHLLSTINIHGSLYQILSCDCSLTVHA